MSCTRATAPWISEARKFQPGNRGSPAPRRREPAQSWTSIASSNTSSRFVIITPPSPVVMILLNWRLNAPASPNVPRRCRGTLRPPPGRRPRRRRDRAPRRSSSVRPCRPVPAHVDREDRPRLRRDSRSTSSGSSVSESSTSARTGTARDAKTALASRSTCTQGRSPRRRAERRRRSGRRSARTSRR